MILRKADFENFRNIEKYSFEFNPKMNILFGKNAQGKTNVIEGIYLFAGGKSFRHAKDSDLRKFDTDWTQVSIDFDTEDRNHKMSIRYVQNKKELYQNNGKIRKLSEFIGTFKAVLFCPAHLSIVQAEPGIRRNFLDSAISQIKPKYLACLMEYQKVLEEKNALLKNVEDHPEGFDTMYQVLTEKQIEDASYITEVRAEYLGELFSDVNRFLKDMSGGKEQIKYRYENSIDFLKDVSKEQVNLTAYRSLIDKYREKEKIVGTCLFGTHRDDFEILLNGKSAKIFCSQGQQRSIALAMKLAEGELSKKESGEYPVFLFDDVLSELDRERKNYVLSQLKERQVIITSCDESDFSEVTQAKKIFVENGTYKVMEE